MSASTSDLFGIRVIVNPAVPDGVMILDGGPCPVCAGRGYKRSLSDPGPCDAEGCFGGRLLRVVKVDGEPVPA